MTWALYLWLAYSPGSLTLLQQFDDRRECLAAKSADTHANVRAGAGGGAHYICTTFRPEDQR